jgi:hypothetical protein
MVRAVFASPGPIGMGLATGTASSLPAHDRHCLDIGIGQGDGN